MGLTPLDVENTRFRGALAGYNRAEVDQFMLRVSQTLEDLLGEIQQLKQQIKQLESEVDRNRESEELLRNSVMLAQKTCDELIATAHRKAELIHNEALHEGDRVRQEFSELRSQREQFEYAFHGLLTGFIHRLEQGNPTLTGQSDTPVLGASASTRSKAGQSPEEIVADRGNEIADSSIDSRPAEFSQVAAGTGQARPPAGKPDLTDRDDDIHDFDSAIRRAEPETVAWPEPVEESRPEEDPPRYESLARDIEDQMHHTDPTVGPEPEPDDSLFEGDAGSDSFPEDSEEAL